MTPLPDDPCALYRFYDVNDVLLYVGITGHLPSRTSEHAADKAWWRQVVLVRVEHFETRAEAKAAEQAAIDHEKPLQNGARSVGKTPLRSFRIPDSLYGAAQQEAAERGESLTDVVRRALSEYGTS